MLVLLLALTAGVTSRARAEPVRDFIVSCSYGVLAGTLVGAATLAFSDHPGDNLNKVARGASLGLYAGILLGAYVVYGGGPVEDEDAAAQLNRVGMVESELRFPQVAAVPTLGKIAVKYQTPPLLVSPVIDSHGVTGGQITARVASF